MMAQRSSLQSQVVRAQFDYLVNGVAADLNRIARRAYAEGLITKPTLQTVTNLATNESDRATGLVSAIQLKIGISHEAFSVFLKILCEEPVVSELADTLEGGLGELEKTTAQKRRSRGGGAGDQRGRGSGGADGKKGGASSKESDSGVADLSNASLPSAAGNGGGGVQQTEQNGLNGDAATEDGVLETTSATFDDSELVECMDGADTCEDGKRCEYTSDDSPLGPVARYPMSIEEVGRAASNESTVTSSSGFLTQLSMTSSVSSTDEAIHNLRMEVSQQKSAVTDCQAQVTGLTQRLERTTQEKLQALSQLKNKEDEVKRITERKDAEIQELHSQIESKEREVACYQHRIADKEKENEELKQQHEVVVKALVEQKDTVEMEIVEIKIHYEEKLKKMEQKLKTANARREEAVLELAAVRISLAEKEAEYNRMLWIHEKDISSLKLRVAEQIATEQTMKADLAECRLTIEKLKRKSVEKKHRDSLSKVKELESGQQETEEKLRQSEAKQRQSEKERQDAQQKHRDSLSKVEELESELARLRLNAVPEDQSHN